MRFAGRWHPAGRRVLYAAVSESLARLEVLAYINRAQWPLDYVLQVLEFPDAWWDSALRPPAAVVAQQQAVSRSWGAQHLGSSGAFALRVPSVLVAGGACDENVVLNADRLEVRAGLKVVERLPLAWDARLFGE